MTVAVTGATGFLGLHLVAALAAEGAQVRILARRDPSHELWRDIQLDVVRGSLEDRAALDRLVAGADAIVHVAGLIKALTPAAFLGVNRDGAAAVAETARRLAPHARFVAVSSLAAREPGLSAYAASKRAGEAAVSTAYADAADRLVILRPPAIYGPWDRETLAFFRTAARPVVPVFGTGRAAAVHVADAAAAIARVALGAGDAGCWALADPVPAGYPMTELLSEAASALGRKPRLLRLPAAALLAAGIASGGWGRVRRQARIFTLGKARELLHPDWSVGPGELLPAAVYRSRIGLADGFRATAAWYRAAGLLT
jgi:nucleoside-diphosphate-sugar epimerase